METLQQSPEIPAHWFSHRNEMHQLLDEWMMAWITTSRYNGLDVKQACRIFILYAHLHQCIRSTNLAE